MKGCYGFKSTFREQLLESTVSQVIDEITRYLDELPVCIQSPHMMGWGAGAPDLEQNKGQMMDATAIQQIYSNLDLRVKIMNQVVRRSSLPLGDVTPMPIA